MIILFRNILITILLNSILVFNIAITFDAQSEAEEVIANINYNSEDTVQDVYNIGNSYAVDSPNVQKRSSLSQVEKDMKEFANNLNSQNQVKEVNYDGLFEEGFVQENPEEASYYETGKSTALDSTVPQLRKSEEYDQVSQVSVKSAPHKKEAKDTRNKFETEVKEYAKKQDLLNGVSAVQDGYVEDVTEKPDTESMTDVFTSFAIIEQMQKDISKDNNKLNIFPGQQSSCSKYKSGFKNCCQDKGWGQGIGFKCSAEEKNLGLKREKKQCVQIGSRTTGSFFNKKTINTFCCFNSTLSRIIAEEARNQLGISWHKTEYVGHFYAHNGKKCDPKKEVLFFPCKPQYKTVECAGLTPEELEKLNLENTDFSDFTNDLDLNTQDMKPNTLSTHALKEINNFYED